MSKRTTTGAAAGSRMSRLMRAPLRALSRARDFYVSSMTGCAGRVHYGAMSMGCPAAIPPRSFSFNQNRLSCDDEADLRELIRAESISRANTRVRRSQSVAVGRIDEDSECEFKDNDVRVGANLIFPRSTSCAAGQGRRIGVVA